MHESLLLLRKLMLKVYLLKSYFLTFLKSDKLFTFYAGPLNLAILFIAMGNIV